MEDWEIIYRNGMSGYIFQRMMQFGCDEKSSILTKSAMALVGSYIDTKGSKLPIPIDDFFLFSEKKKFDTYEFLEGSIVDACYSYLLEINSNAEKFNISDEV